MKRLDPALVFCLVFCLAFLIVAPLAYAGTMLGTPQAPGQPQVIGQDGGVGGVLTFPAGACLRVSAVGGGWGYNVQPLSDGGSTSDGGGIPYAYDGAYAYTWGTCSLRAGPDGGTIATYDGGVVPALPPTNPLSPGDIDPFCLNGQQGSGSGPIVLTTVWACGGDGGTFVASARYSP